MNFALKQLKELAVCLSFSLPTGLAIANLYGLQLGMSAGILLFVLALIWQTLSDIKVTLVIQGMQSIRQDIVQLEMQKLNHQLDQIKAAQDRTTDSQKPN